MHKCTESFSDWLNLNGSVRDWEEGLSVVKQSVDAPIYFVDMKEDLTGARFLGHSLLEMADIPAEVYPSLRQPERQNESLTPEELEFMRAINGLDLSFEVTHKIAAILQEQRRLHRN